MQRRHVEDEAFRGVTPVRGEEGASANITCRLTVPPKEAPANYVPAAAVIRRERALFGFTGRKERVGGCASRL